MSFISTPFCEVQQLAVFQSFISTYAPLARRDLSFSDGRVCQCVSTHAPLARRDKFTRNEIMASNISTHAPLARRDDFDVVDSTCQTNFYSRASCEARLLLQFGGACNHDFYSRASCEARRNYRGGNERRFNFYSRASCEARQILSNSMHKMPTFLLTRLLRGATIFLNVGFHVCFISTHAPLARRDVTSNSIIRQDNRFLLTRLLRGATRMAFQIQKMYEISTHAPLARRDFIAELRGAGVTEISTHAPLARRDFRQRVIIVSKMPFLLTRLLRGATWR